MTLYARLSTIMRSSSAEVNIHLDLTPKEVESKKHKHYAFQIFSLYFFLKYNNMKTKTEKLEFLGQKIPAIDVVQSVDSTDTHIFERTFRNIIRINIFMTACFLWSSPCSTEQKDDLNQRAERLIKTYSW